MFEHQNIFDYGGIEETLESLRQEYLCPISRQVMRNPVVDYEGISYQKEHIQKWYQHNDISPVTNVHVLSKTLFPNYYLQDLINKVEAQLPALCSFIQILKNEILQLRVQNEILRKEVEFDAMSNDEGKPNHNTNAFEGFSKEQKSEKMIMLQYKEKKENQRLLNAQKCEKIPINMRKETFQFIKSLTQQHIMENNNNIPLISERDEYKEQRQKQQKQEANGNLLSKRKMIKKMKLQQCFDLSMQKLLKKSNKNWVQHLDDINVEHTQTASKLTQRIQLKDQSIKRFNETIKTQQMQIAQLNKMVEESQFPEIKIFEKLQNLSAQFKTLLESKNLAKKDQKDNNIHEQLRQLKEQNQAIKHKLSVYQDEEKNLMNEKKNHNEIILTNKQPLNGNSSTPLNISSRPYRIMLPSEKYKADLIQLQDQFDQYKQKKSKEISRQLDLLTIKNEKLQQQSVLLTSQIKRLQQLLAEIDSKHKKAIEKLQVKNIELNNTIKELKNTIQSLKNSAKQYKQINQRGNQTNLFRQLCELSNEKIQLLKLLQEAHNAQQRSLNQSSTQMMKYKGEIIWLNEVIAVRHQAWMFIFFNIFATLDYYTKDCDMEEQNINQHDQLHNKNCLLQIQRSQYALEQNEEQQNRIDKRSKSQHCEEQNINNYDRRQKDLIVQHQINQMIPQNQSQLPKIPSLNSIKLPNPLNHNQQINTQNSLQKLTHIGHFIIEKHKHKILPKYPEVIQNIKQKIKLYLGSLQFNLQKNLQIYGEIYKKSPKQAIKLYQKIHTIYQALNDKTAWNFWSAYKINLDETTLKYNRFQMDAIILLRIIQKYGANTSHWEEVISISSVKQPLDTFQWKTFVKNNYLYPNVQLINLNNNKIEQVAVRELQRWKGLKYINFQGNPLTQDSISHLQRYAKKHPDVKLLFDPNPAHISQHQADKKQL